MADSLERLFDLIKKAGLTPCFWFGLPHCPKCGGDHGDPACSEEEDTTLRILWSELNPGYIKY